MSRPQLQIRPGGLLAPSPNQRRNHLSSPPGTWPPATVEEGTQRRHSSCWKLPSRELPTLWAPSLRLSPVGPCLHPPPPPLLVGLSTCPPLTSPGRLCLENQQEVSFAWTGGDWCCWQQAEGPPGAAAWPLSLVLTHGLALGPLDCVARALHVFFAQASRPTHYTERTWSGGMAPTCPSPRQSCSPTFLSTAPFIALAFAESHTRSAPPRGKSSNLGPLLQGPSSPSRVPRAPLQVQTSSADNRPASGGGAEDPLPALRHRKQSPRAEQAGLAGDFTCS